MREEGEKEGRIVSIVAAGQKRWGTEQERPSLAEGAQQDKKRQAETRQGGLEEEKEEAVERNDGRRRKSVRLSGAAV